MLDANGDFLGLESKSNLTVRQDNVERDEKPFSGSADTLG